MPGTCLGHFFSSSTDSESEVASPLIVKKDVIAAIENIARLNVLIVHHEMNFPNYAS